jgi:hypothetical protein
MTGAAKEAFSRRGRRKGDGQVDRLQEEIARKDQVIAEILRVKKGLWPSTTIRR